MPALPGAQFVSSTDQSTPDGQVVCRFFEKGEGLTAKDLYYVASIIKLVAKLGVE